MLEILARVALILAAFAVVALAVRVALLTRRVDELDERVAFLEPLFDVRRCRVCDCTDDVACMSGCWWVEEDLCSSCADDEASSGSSLEGGRG